MSKKQEKSLFIIKKKNAKDMFTSTTKILQINVIVNLISACVLHQARNK